MILSEEKFKRLYKEANDNIKGDRRAIDLAFEKALSDNAAKRPKIIKYSFLGTAAAAVLVICAAAWNFDLFNLTSQNVGEQMTEATAPDAENDEIVLNKESGVVEAAATESAATEVPRDENSKAADAAFEIKEDEGVSAPKAPYEERTEPNERETTSDTEFIASVGTGFKINLPDETIADSSDSGAGNAENDFEKNSATEPYTGKVGGRAAESRTESSGGAQDDAPLMAYLAEDDEGKIIYYSPEEYFEYIGCDISKINLPYQMEMNILPEYEITLDENGEIAGDTAFFTAENGEKRLEIMTGKIDSVSWALEVYEKTGANTAEFDDGKNVTVYAVKNETSFTMNFENFGEAEKDDVVSQILE